MSDESECAICEGGGGWWQLEPDADTVAEPVGMSAATIGSSAPARDDAPAGAYRNPD